MQPCWFGRFGPGCFETSDAAGRAGSFVTSLRRCVVAMEACRGAHHLGRGFAAQGHEVRLMSPEYVRPYVKAQKNDDLDADRGGGEPADDAVR